MSQSMEYCDNCEKDLPESKFDLHLGYCRRNIRKCADCQRPYDINEEEQHQQEFHSFQKCQYCHCDVQPAQIDAHTINCSFKPVPCYYCELPIPTDKFEQHRMQCEARTRSCEKCERPVTNKDYFAHIETCEGIIEPSPQSQSYTSSFSSPYYNSSAFQSSSTRSYAPNETVRTYTRVTTTDPRTGKTTTVIQDDNRQPARVIRRPYNPSESTTTSYTTATTTVPSFSTQATSSQNGTSQSYSSYVHRTVDSSPYMSQSDDPELQAALLASLGYSMQGTNNKGFTKK